MIKELTKSQLVALKNLLASYKRYSENPNYTVEEVTVMAHPYINDKIYVKGKMKGVSSGRPFNETNYTCLLIDGQQTECVDTNDAVQRREFQDALIPVRVTPEGKIEKI